MDKAQKYNLTQIIFAGELHGQSSYAATVKGTRLITKLQWLGKNQVRLILE
jgi:hypothetical protein